MSIKKTVLSSLFVSCLALSAVVEARGGTGGDGGGMGGAGRSGGAFGGFDGGTAASNAGCSSCGGRKGPPQESYSYRSSYKSKNKSSSCPADARGAGVSQQRGHGGDLIRKGIESRDRDVDHDPR